MKANQHYKNKISYNEDLTVSKKRLFEISYVQAGDHLKVLENYRSAVNFYNSQGLAKKNA